MTYEQTRIVLHRLAAHVLGRRRYEVAGRFGLRISPGGISTPPFGPDGESIRVAGTTLVRDLGATASYAEIDGATIRQLAAFAGADIDSPFSCGNDTPSLGDPDEPLHLSARDTATIADWYGLGWVVLDSVSASLPPTAHPATMQLWPEHFDIGTNVGLRGGDRVNLGCSPGDSFEALPYLYVGPSGTSRPGDPNYWNASFGAVLRKPELDAAADATASGVLFMRTGLEALEGEAPSM